MGGVRYGLGVDLGTTYSAAAIVQDGRPEVVTLGDRAPEVPSVAFLREDGGHLFGEPALRAGEHAPERLAREFKRRLGDRTPLLLAGQPTLPEDLTAQLLRWAVAEVAARQGGSPDQLVVTVPANWQQHRTATLVGALQRTDVGPVSLCAEPIAAAVHFASTERLDVGQTIAVYDLGGGTFDAAVVTKTAAGYEVLGPAAGLDDLGGADFDDQVFDHVARSLGDALAAVDPEDPDLRSSWARLRRDCTEAREHLSSDTSVLIPVHLPGVRRSVRLTRPELEDLVRDRVAATVACLRRALAGADVTPQDLAAVVLVGGAARMPLVVEMLCDDLGRPVTPSPAPKYAVALGAALVAGRSLQAQPRSREIPTTSAPPPPATPVHRPAPSVPAPVPPVRGTGSRVVRSATGGRRSDRLLLIAVLVLPLVGLALAFGVPELRDEPGTPTGVTLGDQPVHPGARLSLDVGRVQELRAPEDVTEIEIEIGLAGLELDRIDESLVSGRADVDLSAPLGSVSGNVRSAITLVRADGTSTVLEPVVLGPSSPDLRHIIVLVAMLLFAAAYVESLLRGVRRRRRARVVDVLGLTVMGALMGVAVSGAAWVFAGLVDVGPAVAVLLTTSLAGGCLAVLAGRRSGRRRPSTTG